MKKEILWLALMTIIECGVAQDTLSLKRQDALDAAVKNNSEVLLATLDQESAVAKFNQTNSAFLPQVALNYTAMVTNNPLNAFGFKLQQQSISPSDFNPQLLNNPSSAQNYATRVELNQPLINLDMLFQRRAAGQQIDIYSYKTKRTKEYLMFEVQKSYAQLQLAHQAVVVLKEALHTINSVYETTKNYYDKGLLQKSSVLQVQVELASIQSKLAEAKSNVRNVSDYISLLMNVEGRPVYIVEALKKNDQNTENLPTLVSENRADFKAMRSAMTAQDLMIASSKMSYLPKLNAFANYVFNSKSAFDFGSNSYFAGVQFSWNLFNGTSFHYRITEQKITRSRIEQQLNYQKEQSQVELNKTYRQLQDTQFALRQHETSVDQATEALRILQNRFGEGLVSVNDLLQSQTTLSEQKLHHSEAVFKYQATLAYLQFLTSTSEK